MTMGMMGESLGSMFNRNTTYTTLRLLLWTLYCNVSVLSLHPGTIERTLCPCADIKLCQPLNIIREKEVFVYSIGRKVWHNYRWDKITTVSPEFGAKYPDPDLLCYAHSKNVSVVLKAGINDLQLNDSAARTVWVNGLLRSVQSGFMDGIAIDFEKTIGPSKLVLRDELIETMQELSRGLQKILKKPQLSFCVPWIPNKAGRHEYGYQELAKVVDFFYVMDYGMGTWGCLNCTTAEANSSLLNTIKGLRRYLELVEAQKLLLSVPWYGFDWKCLQYDAKNHTCWIKRTFNADGLEVERLWKNVPYSKIVETLLPRSFTGRMFDPVSKSPYFAYKDTDGTIHEVRYDDPESLSYKYQLVTDYKLRGSGMWEANDIDYNNTQMVDDFWGQIP